ncbi:MAG: S8 family peptidase [Bacteroidia bacterium]|nr:S8 family peptidase [Bacteroidia bacterium]
MKKITLILAFAAQSLFVFAQKQAPDNWFNLDPKLNKVNGVSTERAYLELLKGKGAEKVIVAVIDGGTEVLHEDLKRVIWVNRGEIANNGIDDDKNGYVDDVNGWNFIGGPDINVDEDNLEVTRLYKQLKPRYEKVDTNSLDGAEKDNYAFFIKVRNAYNKGFKEYAMYNNIYTALENGVVSLTNNLKKDSLSMAEFKAYKPIDMNEAMAHNSIAKTFEASKANYVVISKFSKGLSEAKSQISKAVDYQYNLDFDSRTIVGDNYENPHERYYGNNKLGEPNGEHGTHVAGIIAADRTNGGGINGVSDQTEIMVLRVVPDGDERDKDVANAIRYAVDNGAKIINMSFGKPFSPYKNVVDEAVIYAKEKDVLLVHAAGNDNKNLEVDDNFPNDKIEGYDASNWLEVGASSWKAKKLITAPFSNYGKTTVDVFAPGVDIKSCVPKSSYAVYSGTSMASPVTAGVAAVLRSYYPQLTAAEVKKIIMDSSIKIKGKVLIPGTKKKVKLSEICISGGIVNLYQAVLLAEKLMASK